MWTILFSYIYIYQEGLIWKQNLMAARMIFKSA